MFSDLVRGCLEHSVGVVFWNPMRQMLGILSTNQSLWPIIVTAAGERHRRSCRSSRTTGGSGSGSLSATTPPPSARTRTLLEADTHGVGSQTCNQWGGGREGGGDLGQNK